VALILTIYSTVAFLSQYCKTIDILLETDLKPICAMSLEGDFDFYIIISYTREAGRLIFFSTSIGFYNSHSELKDVSNALGTQFGFSCFFSAEIFIKRLCEQLQPLFEMFGINGQR
jgi:hypothetical protein